MAAEDAPAHQAKLSRVTLNASVVTSV